VSALPDSYSLSQLSDAWQRFGCAICSHTPTRFANEGSRIELHHILSRGQGGTDEPENLMGLCGELTDEKCHWKVTTNRVKISWSENAHSWIWQTADESTIGFCRPLDRSLISDAGMENQLVLSRAPTPAPGTFGITAEVPVEWMPEGTDLGIGAISAQSRFMTARELHTQVERGWLALSLILQYGMAHRDHLQLGFRTVGEWADAIGISKPSMSKLRMVSRTFQGSWQALPKEDQAALSMEGLYLAARMVKLGKWDAEQALREAVAHPVQYLWKIHKDAAGAEIHWCQCPECGANHHKKLEPPLE
jgi:hypothetical protein